MANRYISIDFEYNNTSESHMNLVCCSLRLSDNVEDVREYWTNNGNFERERLTSDLCELDDQGYIFLSYNVVAEAACFYSLGLMPQNFKWICLFTEFRMLTNHHDKLAYGEHYIKGEVRNLKKPRAKWMQTEQERKGFLERD